MSPIFDSEIKKKERKEGEEKKEFLKREEIQTMRKEISKLREIEAQKERERIAALKLEKEKSIPQKPPEIKEKKIEEREKLPVTLIPKPPKGPPPHRKILVRAIVIALIFLLLSVFIWLLLINKVEKAPEEEVEKEIKKEIEEVIKEPEIIIPLSLVSETATATLEISFLEELPSSLSQLLEGSFEPGFTRILIKDIEENKILGLKEFFQAFEIKTPEGFLDKLNNDFTLFIYSGENQRLGFATEIKEKEELSDLLSFWEETLEKDTENLFAVLGKEGEAYASNFKESSFGEISFRFLTISTEDFGICYTSVGNFFVFTTSFESIEKTINELKTKTLTLKEKLGQLFIIGFEGKEITPQLEEIFKKYKPGGVLLLSRNIENEWQLKKLTTSLQKLSLKETGLPLFIAVDQEGGIISRVGFAKEITPQSEIANPNQAFQIGQKREEELKSLGINLNLAPVLDITKEEDFLLNRSFQKNSKTSGILAKFLILGQKAAGALGVIKHFPGYGGVTFDPEANLAKVEIIPEISQFKEAMKANPEFVMTANVVYKNIDPSLPFTFSPKAIQFLKDNLGSEVLIISDDLAQNYLLENFSLKEVVTKPIQAGIDILIFSGWEVEIEKGLEAFYQAFENGEIPEKKVKEAILKIIQLKRILIL